MRTAGVATPWEPFACAHSLSGDGRLTARRPGTPSRTEPHLNHSKQRTGVTLTRHSFARRECLILRAAPRSARPSSPAAGSERQPIFSGPKLPRNIAWTAPTISPLLCFSLSSRASAASRGTSLPVFPGSPQRNTFPGPPLLTPRDCSPIISRHIRVQPIPHQPKEPRV